MKHEMIKLNEINTDASVNMDDIVSVFTSKYEENLHISKDELIVEIKAKRVELEKLVKQAKESIDVSKFTVSHPLFNIEVACIDYINTGEVRVVFDAMSINGQQRLATPETRIKVKPAMVAKITKCDATITMLTNDLQKTLTDLRGIDRKERQVRARIVEQKLEQTGLDHLLKDEGLRKLVELG